jgi:hypothetical protein
LRIMALTSWLDLLCKCKVKHVLCLLAEKELHSRYSDLGEGGLAVTCRGQGLSFQSLGDGALPITAQSLAKAMVVLRKLRPAADNGVAIVCADGRRSSAAVAATWLSLECRQSTEAAVEAVEAAASQVGASRSPLSPGTGRKPLEEFETMVLETSRIMADSIVELHDETSSKHCLGVMD